jgi:hypothetical protein
VVRRFLDRWARQLVRRGIRSGLIEGSNLWLSIGAIAWLFRFLSKRQAPQVSVERLRLGESVVVSHVPAPPRTRRARNKAARKAARRQAKLVAKREASRRHARAAAKAGLAEAAAEERLARSSSRPGKSRRHEREERSARGRPPEPDLEEPGDT